MPELPTRTGPRRWLALAAVVVVLSGAAFVVVAQRPDADPGPTVAASPDDSIGIVRWKVPLGVQTAWWWSAPVAAVGDTVVVSQAGALHGIDPASGEMRWKRGFDVVDMWRDTGHPVAVDGDLLFAQNQGAGGFALRNVDPQTGLDRWVHSEEAGNANLLAAKNSVYLQVWRPDPEQPQTDGEAELARLDPATGKTEWRRTLEQAGWVGATGDDALVLISEDPSHAGQDVEAARRDSRPFTAIVVDGRTGDELWRRSLGVIGPHEEESGFYPVAAVGPDRVVLADTAGRLTAYDVATGSTVWEAAEQRRRERIVVLGDVVLETGERNHVVALSLASGEQRWVSEDRFFGGVTFGTASDEVLLIPYGGTRLTAVDLRDGTTRWISEAAAGYGGSIVGNAFVAVTDPGGNASSPGTPEMRAFDLSTGEELWSRVLPFVSGLSATGGQDWFATYQPGSALSLRDTETGKFLGYPSVNGQVVSLGAGPGGELLLLLNDDRGEPLLSSMGTESRHWEIAVASEEAPVWWSPPVGPVAVGEVVVVARESTVYFHDLDAGTLVGTRRTGSAVVGLDAAPDGVLVRTADGTLTFIPEAGRYPRWRLDLGSGGGLGPAIAGGAAYLATDVGEVAAVDIEVGRVDWRHDFGAPLSEAPAVAGGHVLAVLGQEVVALDTGSGEVRWRAEFSSPPAGPPAALGDGIRLALTDGTVLALDPATGQTTGQMILGDPIAAGPWVFGDSSYVVTAGSRLVAIGPVPEAIATLSPVPIADEP